MCTGIKAQAPIGLANLIKYLNKNILNIHLYLSRAQTSVNYANIIVPPVIVLKQTLKNGSKSKI